LKSYFLQAAYKDDNTLIKAINFAGSEVTYQSWFGVDAETAENNPTFNPAGLFTDENGNTQFHNNQVDDYKQDHYQLHWNQKFDNNWSSNLSLNYTYGRGFFEEYKEDQDFDDYDFTPIELGGETLNTTDLIRRRWLDNDFYVMNASLNYKDNNLDVITGAFYSTYRGDHFGEVIWAQNAGGTSINDRYYDGDATKNEMSAFAKATLFYHHNIFTSVPAALYSEDHAVDYLKYNARILETDVLSVDKNLGDLDIHTVYIAYANINNYFFDRFGSYEYFHYSSRILELRDKEIPTLQPQVYLDIKKSHFYLTIFKNGKLVAQNLFPHDAIEDILYYTMFTTHHNDLDPETMKMILCAEQQEEELFDLLYTYVRYVSYIEDYPNYLEQILCV
jgi:hypothetical protein